MHPFAIHPSSNLNGVRSKGLGRFNLWICVIRSSAHAHSERLEYQGSWPAGPFIHFAASASLPSLISSGKLGGKRSLRTRKAATPANAPNDPHPEALDSIQYL